MSKFKPAKKVYNAQGEETFAHLHNVKPVTRRDFLSTGLLSFSASFMAPTLFDLVLQNNMALAQEAGCVASGNTDLIPVITLNLSGGAAMAANWVPFDQGLQPLPSYDKIGLGNPGELTLRYEMGGAPFAGNGVSQFIVGVEQGAPTAMTGTRFVGVPVRSRDDSDVNKFDISGMVTKAGYNGKFLPNMGSAPTKTGNKNDFSYIKPPTPLRVSRFSDVVGALGLTGNLGRILNTTDKKVKLFDLTRKLNEAQSRRLASTTGSAEMSSLIKCAAGDNVNIAGLNADEISPLNNAQVSTVWGIDNNTDQNSRDFVFAAMVYNGLLGNSGVVNLEMGGYDYHNGTRQTGNDRDLQAGIVVGRILETAMALNKKLFLVVTTDGAVVSAVSNSANSPWMSDRGTAGAAYMMAFDPQGRTTSSGFQIGHFNAGQGAAEDVITGASPELAAAGIFANYLNMNNQLNKLESVIPRVFSTAQLQDIIKIYSS